MLVNCWTAPTAIPPTHKKCINLTNLCDRMPCFAYFYPIWQTGILKKSMQNSTYILLPTKFFVYLAIKSEECYCGQSVHSRCWWNINRPPVQCQEWREAMLRIPVSDTFLSGHLNFIQYKLMLKLRILQEQHNPLHCFLWKRLF